LISLYDEADYDDDGELPLSRYSHCIDIDLLRGQVEIEHALEYQTHVGRVIALTYSSHLNCECRVPHELQRLIGSQGNVD